MRVGVIGGSNLYRNPLLRGVRVRRVETPYGAAEVHVKDGVAFIPRHGTSRKTPPHMVNHHANIRALYDLGVKEVIGLCMTGSMKKNIRPPALVIPHDYVSLWGVKTFFSREINHITPALDERLRKTIAKTAAENGIIVREKGVYVQTTGPRLETKAEVRILAGYGDIVGMTMAPEATLAQELCMKYAAICSVDNYAHGLSKRPLDFRNVLSGSRENSRRAVQLALKTAEKLK